MRQGLTSQEAQRRLSQFGLNVLPEKKPPADLSVFLSQLQSPLIYILLLAAGVTLAIGDFQDSIIIIVAVSLNSLLGFYQERKAQKAITALKKLVTPQARVKRDGQIQIIEAAKTVPGDLVFLSRGDKVPADGVLMETKDLSVDEAILTGEAMPVKKFKENLLFMGTTVVAGRGEMMVTKTGKDSEIGKIAQSLEEKEEATPLEKKLAVLARQLAIFVILAALVIFLAGIWQEQSLAEVFTTSVALAVSAIPEGLTISLTAILAIGMQRILKRKALVRKLLAAETLGSVTVICVDKTGTITEGHFQVVKEDFLDREKGTRAAVLANDLEDPLEVARWEYILAQNHFDPQKIVEENPRLDWLPFAPERRFLAALYQNEVFLSGAPELLLARSTLGPKAKVAWEEKIENWGQRGLRLVGFAWRPRKTGEERLEEEGLKENLQFLGLMAFSDPVREGAREALSLAQEAGIKVKVITGDYRATAEAVLRQIGIKIERPQAQIIEGEELAKLSPEELADKIEDVLLFVRALPSDKLKIVEALKSQGEIVAMTGDGVNDAPAIQKSDIGIVVGTASDVAQETADLILLDNNFATILAAVEEGRGIFDNLRKVILYLLADAFGEVLIVIQSILFGLPLALNPAQILWINLVSDGFPSLALTVDPKRKGLMREGPKDPRENLIDTQIKTLIILVSGFYGVASFLIFYYFYRHFSDLTYARTMAFAVLGINSLFYVFSCRTLKEPVWRTNLLSNPWLVLGVIGGLALFIPVFYYPPLQTLLRTVPLGVFEWGIVAAMGLTVVFLIEVSKFLFMLKLKWP